MSEHETLSVRTFDGACTVPVRVFGEGPPLLYLYGPFGLNEHAFVDALAQQARVYVPTHPGFDGSEGADQLEATVFDIVLHHDELLNGLGLTEPLDVVGHSYGGFLAEELAAVFPARVRRLVLISPLGLWLDDCPQPDLFGLTPGTLARTLFGDAESAPAKELFTMPTEREQARLWNRARRRNTVGAAKYLWPLPDKGFRRRAHRVQAPTLLLWGAQDQVIPPDPYMEAYRGLIRGATAEVEPDAGHMVVLERPAEAAAKVLAHLRAE